MTRRTPSHVALVALVLSLVAVPVGFGFAKATPKSVGTVVALGGSKKLTVDGVPLSKGAKLTLGEHLIMGKGLKATLQLVKPAGAGDKNLVDLTPATGAKFDIGVRRTKGATITVTISPR